MRASGGRCAGLSRLSERSLLAGQHRARRCRAAAIARRGRRCWLGAGMIATVARSRRAARRPASPARMDRTGAFFGAGTLLLVACAVPVDAHVRRARGRSIGGRGGGRWRASGAATRPSGPGAACSRSRVIASATFILICGGRVSPAGPIGGGSPFGHRRLRAAGRSAAADRRTIPNSATDATRSA